jgi:hypothetical protein
MAELEAAAAAPVVDPVPQQLVVMLVSSGQNDKVQWFEYRPSYFGDIIRVEWDAGTMNAALPEDVASYLLGNGYARAMTDDESKAYDGPAEGTESAPVPEDKPEPVPRPKRKGD